MKKIILSAALLFASVAMVNAQMSWGVKAGYNNSNYDLGFQGASAGLSLGSKHGFYAGGVGNWQFADKFSLQFELLYSLDGTKLRIGDKLIDPAWEGMGDLYTSMSGAINNYINSIQDPAEKAQAQALANTIGGLLAADAPLDEITVAANFHNISIPVLVKFQPAGGLSVLAGPTFSYTVGNNVKLNKDTKDMAELALSQLMPAGSPQYDDYMDYAGKVVKENIAKFKLNLTLGVEYAFCDNWFVDARYNYNILNSFKNEFVLPAEGKIGINQEQKVTVKNDMKDAQPRAKYHSFQVGLGYKF